MPWTVEYTDEFGAWWASPAKHNRMIRIASSGCSKPEAPSWAFLFLRDCRVTACPHAGVTVQSGGHPSGSFMPLIRAARLFCSSVATRLATTASMTPISPSRIGSAMPISQNSDVKDGSHEWTSPV